MKEDGFQQNENLDDENPKDELNVYASKEEAAEALEDAFKNIKNFNKRLHNYTLGKIRYYFNANSFRGNDAKDVVQTVIKRILTLRRKWYKNKIPDFHKFVRFAILSYIRNERKKKDRLIEVELYDEEDNLTSETINEIIKEFAREDVTEKYFRDDLEILIQKCMDELKDDVYAAFVLEERLNREKSNIKIAANLGIEVCEVENARKRIRNKFQGLLKDNNR